VLCKAVVRQGARRLLTIGDGTVEYNDAFRLYLTTKLPNPHYPPEVCAPPPPGPGAPPKGVGSILAGDPDSGCPRVFPRRIYSLRIRLKSTPGGSPPSDLIGVPSPPAALSPGTPDAPSSSSAP